MERGICVEALRKNFLDFWLAPHVGYRFNFFCFDVEPLAHGFLFMGVARQTGIISAEVTFFTSNLFSNFLLAN